MNLPIYEPKGSKPEYFLRLHEDDGVLALAIVGGAGADVGAQLLTLADGVLELTSGIDAAVAEAVGIKLDSAGRIKVIK